MIAGLYFSIASAIIDRRYSRSFHTDSLARHSLQNADLKVGATAN